MRQAIALRLVLGLLAAVPVACTDSSGGSPDATAPIPCSGASDCDDDDPCTIDQCIAGHCNRVARDCDDDNPCTEDRCNQGACAHNTVLGCCVADGDCDDGDFCTPDRCLNLLCASDPPVADCCNSKDPCDDGDECTYDDCLQHACTHLPDTGAGCCKIDKDCLDGNECTGDRCVDDHCVHENLGCCASSEDCTSEDPCQVGACESRKCVFTTITDCCRKDEDCPAVVCTRATCVEGECQRAALEKCCVRDDDCLDACLGCAIPFGETAGSCTLKTTPECCTTTLLTAAFSDLSGFTVEGMPGAGYSGLPEWVVDAKRSVSPPSSLYFGDPATHTYEAGATSKAGGRAVSPSLDLGSTLTPMLTFQVYKDTDAVPASDILSVLVLASGQADRVAWSSATASLSSTNGTWMPISVNLSPFQGEVVQLAFQFDTVDTYPTTYEGTYVDDVKVAGRCP